MDYRTLGKTGLKVSSLSYGASSLGGVFRDIDESEGIKTVHRALDLGINYIDVAPYYGNTQAETILGKALKGVARDQYYIATKVGRYGEKKFDFSAERTIESVDESLKRLQLDYVDVIQCHDIEFVQLDQIVEETIPTLHQLREKGKVRFVGITGLPLHVFRYVLDRAEVDTVLSYCHYTLIDTSLMGLLPVLHKHKVGVINASPLAMGLLTERGAPKWHPAAREIRKTCAQAAKICKEQGIDIAKLALQYAHMNQEISTTIVGTADPENIQKNVAWIKEPIDIEILEQVLAIIEPIKDETWSSGLAENQ